MTDIDNNKEEMLSEILGDNEFVFTEQTDENVFPCKFKTSKYRAEFRPKNHS